MSLPKVLVISQPFNNDTGGGITLSNLFAGWERDKIAVICSGYVLQNNIDTSICNTYYQLGEKEQKWIFPFNLVKRKYKSGMIHFDEKRIQNLSFEKSKIRVKLIMGWFNPFLRYTGLIHVSKKLELSQQLRDFLDEFNPDVLYIQAEDRERVAFCIDVYNYVKKPMVFHMMDDWPSIISERGFLKNFWERKINSELLVLLNLCSEWMSICDEMTNEYRTRYGLEFIPFHNPVDLNFWKPFQRKNYKLTNSPTILYAGRIGLGIDSSLELIAGAIDQINNELNINARFILQTESKPEWAEKFNCVQHQSFVPYSELPHVFSSADFLILPYDFSSESIKYIKYSMPTKASEFMISGTPVILFAPEETAVVKYARQYNWAEIVTENSKSKMVEAIKSLILSEEKRKMIAQNAIQTAEKNHNATEITRQFKEVIVSLVGKNQKLREL
jgi:glycosyltransferase involved in cell wall biosynthesis